MAIHPFILLCLSFLSFLYVREDSIMVSDQTILFSPIELKLFFWAFQTSWTPKWPITYVSVIMWFCDRFVCVTLIVIISISKYLPISTKFGTNIHQCSTSGCFFFSIYKFSQFLLTFSVFWDSQFFLGEIQTTSKSIFYGFYWVNWPF